MIQTCLRLCVVTFLSIAVSGFAAAQTPATDPPPVPAQLEQWKTAVLAGDAAALQALYSADPAAKVMVNEKQGAASADVNFWIGLKARSIKIDIVRVRDRNDLEGVIFNAQIVTGLGEGKTVSVADDQVWQKQGDQWRLRSVTRTDAPQLKQPSSMTKDIYPADADAHTELKVAEQEAA